MKKVDDIVIESPTKATMKFNSPAPTMPQWMSFLGSYVVPKNYIESKGLDNFLKSPVGTGPYKLAEYELNSRIVLERNDNYWGPKAKIARVTIQIIKDPSARVAAIQSGAGRLHNQRPGSRSTALPEGRRIYRRDQSDHPRDPDQCAQRSGVRGQERAPCRASRHQQVGACRRHFTAAPRCRSRCWRHRARPAISATSLSNTIPRSPSSF